MNNTHSLAGRLRQTWPALALFGAVMLLWEFSVDWFDVPSFLLPPPSVIFLEMAENWQMLLKNLWATMLAAILGFALGTAVAIALAILFLYSRTAERALFPWAITIKTIPVLAIAPLLTIWLGYGIAPKVAIAALICFFPTLVNAVKGFRTIDSQTVEFFRIAGASKAQLFRHARLYAALPYIFAAAKISASMSVIGAIVAEFTGANSGIGTLIVTAGYQMDATMLFAAIVASSIATIALFYVVVLIERFSLYWPEARIDA
ncbi:ABC transporter permease [Thalassorhabdomicrobium marinisediminis]|uniref:ABC transporter permease n=1 Tax=Thalassorhabdomicrobium marinisediminis TaxID=2170577 RepID=A0A2T7FWR7_9RHOB|nr:ABC transporter permease [Thalassorhabdomicrobium marinisediminis]PVA06615.1 ABC transporter permease [Thalassorhabdomicrobium marinisediminis]